MTLHVGEIVHHPILRKPHQQQEQLQVLQELLQLHLVVEILLLLVCLMDMEILKIHTHQKRLIMFLPHQMARQVFQHSEHWLLLTYNVDDPFPHHAELNQIYHPPHDQEVAYAENPADLFYVAKAMQDDPRTKDLILNQMRKVKEKHTYVNRLKDMIAAAEML